MLSRQCGHYSGVVLGNRYVAIIILVCLGVNSLLGKISFSQQELCAFLFGVI